MTAKVAVAVIHGIASQARKRPPDSSERSFSDGLYRRLERRLGAKRLAKNVAWREVFWADLLQPRQERFLSQLECKASYRAIRNFIVQGIGDAAAFQPAGAANSAYAMVQGRVSETLADLNEDTSDDTPLVILAHSFGGWILSNYVWDLQHGRMDPPTRFQGMRTTDRLITFGSNIPLFTFAYEPEDVWPIYDPAAAHPGHDERRRWWLNFYDRDDVIGFPLAPIGPHYQALADRGELADIEINAGGLFTSWNPLSHERYWTDGQFVRPVAEILKTLIAQ